MREADLKWRWGNFEGATIIPEWQQSIPLVDPTGKLWLATRRGDCDPSRYIIRQPHRLLDIEEREKSWLWDGGEGGCILELMCAIEHFGLTPDNSS